MAQLISELREQDDIEKICKANSLNMSLLEHFFLLAGKGYNNADIARKIGVHRITIQRYSTALRQMKNADYQKLVGYMAKKILEKR